MMRHGFFAFALVFGALLLFAGVGAPLSLLAQTGDQPEAQPPTTVERLEGDEDGVLEEGNKRIVGVGIVLVALTVLTTLILAFRRGRQNRPPKGLG